MTTPRKLFVPGFCLRINKKAKFSYPENVMGASYFCEGCQQKIKETKTELLHVFEPSKPLLDKLTETKKAKP
jgi:hypothetical protein